MTCPCGGTYTCDAVTAEVGGYVTTRPWSDDYCDRCGKSVGEVMDFDREVYDRDDDPDPDGYCPACSGRVLHKRISGRRSYMARFAEPGEDRYICENCGEVDEMVEHPLEEGDSVDCVQDDEDSVV